MNSKKRGFTLIEILIAVAIIGIIAGIAIPSYRGYIKKSKTQKVQIPLETIAAYLDTLIANGESIKDLAISDIPKKMRKGVNDSGNEIVSNGESSTFTITLDTPNDNKYTLKGELHGFGYLTIDETGLKKSYDGISWIK
ncbi:hypothetical protein CSA08_04300 [Candidatus Gracilibacteria bacterium]|nr:MAG: hypothetical protein CSA08_04300 [Candidatus Gracilibacteria bacterium]